MVIKKLIIIIFVMFLILNVSLVKACDEIEADFDITNNLSMDKVEIDYSKSRQDLLLIARYQVEGLFKAKIGTSLETSFDDSFGCITKASLKLNLIFLEAKVYVAKDAKDKELTLWHEKEHAKKYIKAYQDNLPILKNNLNEFLRSAKISEINDNESLKAKEAKLISLVEQEFLKENEKISRIVVKESDAFDKEEQEKLRQD